jgi:hypothetical protein
MPDWGAYIQIIIFFKLVMGATWALAPCYFLKLTCKTTFPCQTTLRSWFQFPLWSCFTGFYFHTYLGSIFTFRSCSKGEV